MSDNKGSRERATPGTIDSVRQIQMVMDLQIHILGVGNVGKLVAHSIRTLENAPPVVLLFHRPDLLEAWVNRGQTLTVHTHDGKLVESSGFDVELLPQDIAMVQPGPLISCLVLATKAVDTIPALQSIRERLRPTSTIVFLQNGIGIIDEVNRQLFPDANSRPHYLQGVVFHGVFSPDSQQDSFAVTHAGHNTLYIGSVLQDYPIRREVKPYERPDALSLTHSEAEDPSCQAYPMENCDRSRHYIARVLLECTSLSTVLLQPYQLFRVQLQKLAVNATINPITALFDVACSEILPERSSIWSMLSDMLREISAVVQRLPELRSEDGLEHDFSFYALLRSIETVRDSMTANFVPSMLADLRRNRPTEIDYINGYILRRAEELGVHCPVNLAVVHAIRMKWNPDQSG